MELYHSTDADGVSLVNPDAEAMRELLAQLDSPSAEDAEHPDISLIHDSSGWCLSVFPSGTVTFENLEAEDSAPLFMTEVSRADALQMWLELSRGEIENLQQRSWVSDGD